MTDLERKAAAFRPSWERLGAPADRLGLRNSQLLVRDARRMRAKGLIESRYHGGCLQWRAVVNEVQP